MLDADLLDLLNVRDVAGYKSCIARFAQRIGFRTVDALTVLDRGPGQSEFICVDNIGDPGWGALDPGLGKRCPVMQHCRRSSYPIAWGAANYRDPALTDLYDLVASMGLRSGVSVASHFPDGRHFAFCVHTDAGPAVDDRQLAFALPKLELYAVYALDAAFRLLLPPERSNVGELVARDIEALRYALDGWSGRMLADRFNMADAACRDWLGRVAAKLDCGNVRQAALKARRIGVLR